MLATHKVFEAPRLDASYGCHSLLHSRYQCLLTERRGIVSDIGQVAASTIRPVSDPRLQVILPLVGRVGVRSAKGSYWLQPGEIAIEGRRTYESNVRQEGSFSRTLVLNWDPAWLDASAPSTGAMRLSPTSFRRIEALAPRLAGTLPTSEAAKILEQLVSVLRAEGLPYEKMDSRDLLDDVPHDFIQISQALDYAFANLREGPMLVDLQRLLRWPRQRITQTLQAFHRRYGTYRHDGSWRSVMRNWRLGLGVELMSAEGATTEGVAALLGYNSPESIFRAFANASLPSPGEARERVLREAS